MLTLHIAYTEQVNCSDPSVPNLTQEQVWKGLEWKVRRPQDFIPSFDDARIVEERDNGSYVIREAHVAADLAGSVLAGQWAREECRLYKPVMAHFTLPGGSTILNILSTGPNDALNLTFTYEWKLPDIEPGSPEAQTAHDDHMRIAISSVQGTIKALRKMVEEGRL